LIQSIQRKERKLTGVDSCISWACAGRLYPSHGPALKAQESIRLLVFNLQSHGVMVLKVRRETALKGQVKTGSCRIPINPNKEMVRQ
jgi:hypothetical protein